MNEILSHVHNPQSKTNPLYFGTCFGKEILEFIHSVLYVALLAALLLRQGK